MPRFNPKKNDEARMTNDEGMTKLDDEELHYAERAVFDLSFAAFFVIRHSDFVIVTRPRLT
jgi:hypothetical protein